MKQVLAHTSLLVESYDTGIEFFVNRLGFSLKEDTTLVEATDTEKAKRWVVVAPSKSTESALLLAEAANDTQALSIGNQAGGRVFMFLQTDDFWRDYNRYKEQGVEFIRGEPRNEVYGTVAVFLDVSGNMWDLIERK